MENTAVLENPVVAPEAVVEEKNEALEIACKRALDEINALQMAQQILSMVEQSMQKPLVKEYNVAGVKKYLHELYSLPKSAPAEEVNGMEFIFWQEVQLWRSSLSQRDSFISASDLRHYCESSRPPLSEQALISLARFYRGLSASERTVLKFDMIVTRLFAIDEEDGSRRLPTNRMKVAEGLGDFYKEWLGISPQNVIEEDKIAKAVAKFDGFVNKAVAAENLEALIGNSFFGAIRELKKELSQVFYAPAVAAAAINCNVRVGNRFLELLDKDREEKKAAGARIESLDPLLEQAVSEATTKSLQFVYDARKNQARMNELREQQRLLEMETLSIPEGSAGVTKSRNRTVLGVNKWLLAGGFIAVLLSVSLYFWADYGSAANASIKSADKLDEKTVPGGEYLSAARLSNGIFYGVVNVKWISLSDDEKKKVLGELLKDGKAKGFSTATMLNNDGNVVARADEKSVTISN